MWSFSRMVIGTLEEAESILEELYAGLRCIGEVDVGEYYELCGCDSSFTDAKYGWRELVDIQITYDSCTNGYILGLPDPIFLSNENP